MAQTRNGLVMFLQDTCVSPTWRGEGIARRCMERRLEIARALATRPALLLLDEPAAGMNPAETLELIALIRRIRDLGVTVVLVEHDMKVVMQVSENIVVLDHGEKIAEGPPGVIQADERVIEAYFGR